VAVGAIALSRLLGSCSTHQHMPVKSLLNASLCVQSRGHTRDSLSPQGAYTAVEAVNGYTTDKGCVTTGNCSGPQVVQAWR
jgi:hypothetical protein